MCLANKYIYVAQRIVTEPRLAGIPQRSQRVLRCVLCRDPAQGFDQATFERWLAEGKAVRSHLGQDIYPLPRLDKRDRRLVSIDHVEVCNSQRVGSDLLPTQ
jgi:hypothetical protein